MPVTYTLVPIPIWYFADNQGRPLGAGSMSTWRSADKITPKAIYTDPGGVFPWANPVLFNANGEAPGMFFWADDEPYFIEVFDKDGLLIFTVDGYGPGISGGGGGGNITTNVSLDNLIINNVFWRNAGTISNATNGTIIAPGAHEGFHEPDIQFIRDGSTGTNSITFTKFTAGEIPLTGDITPEYYINFNCSGAGNETVKYVQIPVDLHVKNLEQTQLTAGIWANGVSGSLNLTMDFVQFFGTGSATSPVVTSIPINASPLTQGAWQYYSSDFITPSVSGKVLGDGGDDATFIRIGLPAAQLSNILFTKPKLYLGLVGNVFPEIQLYDDVDATINSPRTGDIRTSLNSFAPFGWVAMNDGTIGNTGSGATNRANQDTWQLYNLIWNSVLDHWAPVNGGRGASAIADFGDNKPIALTRALGRAFVTNNALTITGQTFTTNHGAFPNNLNVSSNALFPTGTPIQFTNTGGALPANILTNTVYFAVSSSGTPTILQLATTLDNAHAGVLLDIGTDETGTSTVLQALGAYVGESEHSLTAVENGPHTHTFGVFGASAGSSEASSFNSGGPQTATITVASSGNGIGHNNIPPETFMNVFLKL